MEIPKNNYQEQSSITGLGLRSKFRRIVLSHGGSASGLVASYVPSLMLGGQIVRDELDRGIDLLTIPRVALKAGILYSVKFATFYGVSAAYYNLFPEHGHGMVSSKIKEQIEHIKNKKLSGAYDVLKEDVGIGIKIGFRVLEYITGLPGDPVLNLPKEYSKMDYAFDEVPYRRIEFR